MSYIVRNITSNQSDGEIVFLNKFINKLTEDSNGIITFDNSNLLTKTDNEVWYIQFLIYGKYILKISQKAVNNTSYNISYSIDDGNSFTDIHTSSWSVSYLDSAYELNYLLIENDTCCYLILTNYSTNVLTLDNINSNGSSTNYSSFLFIKKDTNTIISYQSQTSSAYYLQNASSSNTNTNATFDIIESSNKCKLNNGLTIESTDRIFYSPKIVKTNATTGDFVFSCGNDLLDVSYVPLFAKFIINNHRYFSISYNTLIRID